MEERRRSRNSRALMCAVVLFFLAFCCLLTGTANALSSASSSSNDADSHTIEEVVDDELIVVFHRYMLSPEQKALLDDLLREVSGWEVVDRENPAYALPSDFALLKILDEHHKQAIIKALESDKRVKHVFPQKMIINSLKEFEEEEVTDQQVQNSFPSTSTADRIITSLTDDDEESKSEEEEDPYHVRDTLGRMHTPFPQEDERMDEMRGRRRLHSTTVHVPHLFNADFLWDKMYTGTGVRVAIFDTGLGIDSRFRNIKDRSNWTNEKTFEDGLGHGTFVAGVIASQDDLCPGFAPDAEIYVFRVFTNDKVSYTSWFLDAFNYAIHSRINVLNLSIGGPDFMDIPFVEKVWEMSANNIIVVSAIGNDGPLYGTLNNPADQADVIGVGGIDFSDKMASFSSRGMTTWELPLGYGRVKPDIVAYGQSVSGSRLSSGCRTLSGTSVASPVVAGAVALLLSTVPEHRRELINPASMKQALIESTELLPDANIFEQGMGKFNLLRAYEILANYKPKASVLPRRLDLTECPYMWPYCAQPLYYGAAPIIVNITILNGMGVSGKILDTPKFYAVSEETSSFVEVAFASPEILWPWTGNLGLHIRITEEAANWNGIVEGVVEFVVTSPPGVGEKEMRESKIEIPIKLKVVPTPPRHKRLLWDQFHNLRYPSGYFPRDALHLKNEPFDWNGDHIHTNFRDMFTHIRSQGYFMEILGESYNCFNASQYGTLLIVDPEEEFFPEEIEKLHRDVVDYGLSVVVFADWYNVDVMKKIKFFDENTKQLWTPATGGSNIPALNDLLGGFGIEFGDRIYDGDFDAKNLLSSSSSPSESVPNLNFASFSSGTSIAKFPAGGLLVSLELADQTVEILSSKTKREKVPVLGLVRVRNSESMKRELRAGRISVFGDSSCLDNASKKPTCFPLLDKMLAFSSENQVDDVISAKAYVLEAPYQAAKLRSPERIPENDLWKYSKVINGTVGETCSRDTLMFMKANKSELRSIVWEEPIYIPSEPRSSYNGGGASSMERGAGATGGGASAGASGFMSATASILSTGYVVPYLLFFLGVVFVILLALKRRPDPSTKNLQV